MINFTRAMLTGKIQRLSNVHRYSSIGVIRRENVAEHGYYVILYSNLIAQYLSTPVDIPMTKALFHDIDESVTGDFQRTFKYHNPELRAMLDNAARQFVSQIAQQFENVVITDTMVQSWIYAKDLSTVSGQIVAVADFLAVVSYAIQELQLGNRNMRKVYDECREYRNQLQDRLKSTLSHPHELIAILDHAIEIFAEEVMRCE